MQNELIHSLTATFEGYAQHTDPDHFADAGKMIELGSGIPRVLKEWPQIDLISKITGNQFTARVQWPAPQWQAIEQVTEQITGQVTALLVAIGEEALSRKAIMGKLSLKGRDNFEKLYLAPALSAGLIERTIPDKPNSRLQQYRLTVLGRQWLQESEQGKRHE
jgi:hypothetical protein